MLSSQEKISDAIWWWQWW